MRYNDFKLTEAQVRERVKARYPDLTEEQIDEIIPALGAVGGAIAKGAAAAGKIGARRQEQDLEPLVELEQKWVKQ